jgi:membrane-associated PAP2 superfamily phosphatase
MMEPVLMTLFKMLFLQPRVRGLLVIFALVSFGLASTAFLEIYAKDLEWIASFYSPGGANDGWVQARYKPWGLIYDYGEIPGIAVAIGALILFVGSSLGKASTRYKKPCLVVVLTVIIGPGILVNGLLKNCWGRPRPIDITAFGGTKEYRNVFQPGGPGEGKSFTCGHCAIAFSISAVGAFFPYFPSLSIVCLGSGIAYGVITGVARIAQGGHFPTDVLWSGVVVFITIAFLYYVVFRIPDEVRDSE